MSKCCHCEGQMSPLYCFNPQVWSWLLIWEHPYFHLFIEFRAPWWPLSTQKSSRYTYCQRLDWPCDLALKINPYFKHVLILWGFHFELVIPIKFRLIESLMWLVEGLLPVSFSKISPDPRFFMHMTQIWTWTTHC